MILDNFNEFADAATLVGTAAAAAVLGNVIDTGATPTTKDIGNGEGLYLVIQIDTAVAASGGAANVTFKLVSDSVSTLDSSPTVHWASAAIAKGTLVKGYLVVAMELPYGEYERYLGVTYTPDTNNTTAGKANAFLTRDVAKWAALPDAI